MRKNPQQIKDGIAHRAALRLRYKMQVIDTESSLRDMGIRLNYQRLCDDSHGVGFRDVSAPSTRFKIIATLSVLALAIAISITTGIKLS